MSVLYDYFTAETDDDAAAMVGDGPDGELLLLELKGLDPHDLVDVEVLLTGAGTDPRIIATLNDDHNLVLRLGDGLRDGLATATAERLAEVARSWAAIRGATEHQDALVDLLGEFGWLAREARDDGVHLYCWVGV
jgi:hypothetical protein